MAGVDAATSDFKFLLDREGVPIELQTRFFDAGIINLRQFAAFVPDTDELRKSLKDDFGLDPGTGLPAKILISKVVVAWGSAKVRASKLAEAEAEAEVRREAKPVRGTDFKALREAYEAKWWKLEKEQVPARAYIEKVSEGIERAEPHAEALTEVVNVLEGEVDVLKAVWDVGGVVEGSENLPHGPLAAGPRRASGADRSLGQGVGLRGPGPTQLPLPPREHASAVERVPGLLARSHCYRLYARNAFGNVSSPPMEPGARLRAGSPTQDGRTARHRCFH